MVRRLTLEGMRGPHNPNTSYRPSRSRRRRPRQRQAWANFWKALARCDRASDPSGGMPCFSSALISPKVRAWPSGLKMGS